MTITKTACGILAIILFALKMVNVQLGSLDLQAAGLACLSIALLPI